MDYPFIRAYGVRMGWTNEYTKNMLTVATNENAPQTAVLRRLDSTWATIDELGDEERKKVEVALQRETWNVALWLGNDEGLYNLARDCGSYAATVEALREQGVTETPDHVAYNDTGLDLDALEECVREFGS